MISVDDDHRGVDQFPRQTHYQWDLSSPLIGPGTQVKSEKDGHDVSQNIVPLVKVGHCHLDLLLNVRVVLNVSANLLGVVVIHRTRFVDEEGLFHDRGYHVGHHVQEERRLYGDLLVPSFNDGRLQRSEFLLFL